MCICVHIFSNDSQFCEKSIYLSIYLCVYECVILCVCAWIHVLVCVCLFWLCVLRRQWKPKINQIFSECNRLTHTQTYKNTHSYRNVHAHIQTYTWTHTCQPEIHIIASLTVTQSTSCKDKLMTPCHDLVDRIHLCRLCFHGLWKSRNRWQIRQGQALHMLYLHLLLEVTSFESWMSY